MLRVDSLWLDLQYNEVYYSCSDFQYNAAKEPARFELAASPYVLLMWVMQEI